MKKIISVFLILIICTSILSVTTLAKEQRDFTFENELAMHLKELKLFKGVSNTDFALERKPTRIEALVMLIRVLGKETDALTKNWSHPFTDVPYWADKYVGYAYENGLTNGTSSTTFGINDANSAMYITFVLRALGYSDTNGEDFTYENPYVLAKKSEILPEFVDIDDFLRADVVIVSYAALSAKLKGSDVPLSHKLMDDGVFDFSQYVDHYDRNAIGRKSASLVNTKNELSSKEIFNRCSPSVICIETYDVNAEPCALGSGFFITSNGVAVTNFHVLEDATFAIAKLGNNWYTVMGVLYANKELDFAVIKTNATNVPYLNVGDSSDIYSGDEIYTIGNPQGLTNTISNGIISNPKREDFNGMIQITAPISSGSSGGALLNSRGEVIGITTATLTSGQNLNFAVPINEVVNKKDLFSIESNYDMLTMEEFAKLNGYNSKPISSNETRQKQAFEALKTFIVERRNDIFDEDNDPAYTEHRNSEKGYLKYTIAYEDEYDSISIRETYIYQNEDNTMFMQLTPDDDSNLCMFINSLAGGNASTMKFKAIYTIDATNFNENSAITFEEVDGDVSKKTYYTGLAKIMNLDMLNFVDYIFSTYLDNTGFSVSDL